MFFRKKIEQMEGAGSQAPQFKFRAFVDESGMSGPAQTALHRARANDQLWAERSAKFVDLKVRLHQAILDTVNLSVIEKMDPQQFHKQVGELVGELLQRETLPITDKE